MVWSGADYNPGVGFLRRTDFTQFNQEISYTYRHGDESRFIWNEVEVEGDLFLHYNSVVDSFSTNARFRYNFSEGHDLWIVYNENLNTNIRQMALPEMPRSDFRAFMVKYTYTFIL